jgi:Zn finger protein HypA/HybF involved in hydrogenase expression
MPARITCPHCHEDLRLPEHLYDGPAQCPRCGGAFAVEWTPRPRHHISEATASSGAFLDQLRRPCRFCGKTIPLQAGKCPLCGERLGE